MSENVPNDTMPLPRRRSAWQRSRIYVWSIALIFALWGLAGAVLVRDHPQRVFDYLAAKLPFPASAEKVVWLNADTFQLVNLKLGDFFYADSVTVSATLRDLWRRHIGYLMIQGGQLFTKPLFDMMDRQGSSNSNLDWTISTLEVRRGTLMLDDLIGSTPIPVRLGVRQPILLHWIKLGAPDSSLPMTRERNVDIENVNIVSPFDPLAPVLAFPLTRVRFTYAELWHHHIRGVELVEPVMYLGQDLFWFSDQIKQDRNAAPTPSKGVTAPWTVGEFDVKYGQLAVNVFGQPAFKFPFYFGTSVADIRLDQLDKISAKSVIAIQRLDANYPDYKLNVDDLEGRLYFSWPPSDTSANNVVNTISIASIAWNDIAVTGVTTSVTFDPNGVYGKLGGKCEGGQLYGNFEVYYTKGFKWNIDFAADKINCQPIAQKLAGKYFDLTGELDGKLAVQGQATEVLQCKGSLKLPNPGQFRISSLDDMLKRLPVDTPAFKRQAIQIALDALRTYPYAAGEFNVDYTPGNGKGSLELNGPQGKRKFDIYWHPFENPKVANDAPGH